MILSLRSHGRGVKSFGRLRRHYLRCIITLAALMLVARIDFARQATSTASSAPPPIGVVIVSIVGPDGNSLHGAFDVKIMRAGTMFTDQSHRTDQSGTIQFTQLPYAEYEVTASGPGYKDGSTSVNVSGARNTVTASVMLEPTADNPATPPDEKGLTLAPAAKKEASAGVSAMHTGRYDEAEQHLNAAYALAPGNPDVNVMLGELFVTTKDFDKAQNYIARAISIEPDNAAAQADMGYLRIQDKDYSAARTNLERAVVLAPKNWFAHWLLGLTYLRLNQPAKAQIEAAAAVKVGKARAADAQYLLGESLALQGRKGEAIKALQKFLKDSPENSNASAAETLITRLQSGEKQTSLPSGATSIASPSVPIVKPGAN